MRTTTIIEGIKDSQKIRVIINGVGFYTTVKGVDDICFSTPRTLVYKALHEIAGSPKIKGFASRGTIVINGKPTEVDYQVDLVV
jgi:hypothetical protein